MMHDIEMIFFFSRLDECGDGLDRLTLRPMGQWRQLSDLRPVLLHRYWLTRWPRAMNRIALIVDTWLDGSAGKPGRRNPHSSWLDVVAMAFPETIRNSLLESQTIIADAIDLVLPLMHFYSFSVRQIRLQSDVLLSAVWSACFDTTL